MHENMEQKTSVSEFILRNLYHGKSNTMGLK